MPVISHWLEYLDRVGLRYSHSVHPWAKTALETADAERIPPHELAKTVVYFCKSGFGIAVVRADQIVDLEKLGRLIGAEQIRLAREEELAILYPHCELGAMPPFTDVCDMPITVDASVAGEFIAFTIGTHRDIVRMSFIDFQRVAKPRIARIGVNREIFV